MVVLPVRGGSREIRELARAIEVLRAATLAAAAAAAHRRESLQRRARQLREVLDTIGLLHARAVTITDLLPALLDQLGMLARAGPAPPDLAAAIAAVRNGMTVLRDSSARLDAALRRMQAAGDADGADTAAVNAVMAEVTASVARRSRGR